jgi:hypothetical protein
MDGRIQAAPVDVSAAPSAAGAAARCGAGVKLAAVAGLATAGRLALWNTTTFSAVGVAVTIGAGDAHAATVAFS